MRIVVAALTLVVAGMAQAAADASDNPGKELVAKIDQIAALAALDRSITENILGIPKYALADAPYPYSVYKLKLGDVTLEKFDFERPRLLVFKVAGACISRDFVSRTYAPVTITAHRQHYPPGPTYYKKDVKWGQLSFGFPGDLECLEHVVFTIARTE